MHVYIGGVEMTGSPFTLAPGASTRMSFAGVNNGPVKIDSNVNIVAAERVIYKVNGVTTSFSEMMGLPDSSSTPSTGCPGTTTSISIPNSGSAYRKRISFQSFKARLPSLHLGSLLI